LRWEGTGRKQDQEGGNGVDGEKKKKKYHGRLLYKINAVFLAGHGD
jgi:hypothetical protein